MTYEKRCLIYLYISNFKERKEKDETNAKRQDRKEPSEHVGLESRRNQRCLSIMI